MKLSSLTTLLTTAALGAGAVAIGINHQKGPEAPAKDTLIINGKIANSLLPQIPAEPASFRPLMISQFTKLASPTVPAAPAEKPCGNVRVITGGVLPGPATRCF